MKDLGGARHVLEVRIRRQREQHTLYLSQEKYIEKVLDIFFMADAKPLGVPSHHMIKSLRKIVLRHQKQSMTCKVYLMLQVVVHLCMLWLLLDLILPMQWEL